MKFYSFFTKILYRKHCTNFGKYALVQPREVTPRNIVPEYIKKPSYALTGVPVEHLTHPELKNENQIEHMRKSCQVAAKILKEVENKIAVGQTTDDIDVLVHRLSIQCGAYPSPLNYRDFPKSVCTSVNNVACHGIPDVRALEDGDIINVDITVFYEGYHGDCSKTFLIGNVDEAGRKLVAATEICLNEGISVCRPGAYFRDIGASIEEKANQLGFQIIPAFIGHGIGHYFHGPPDIYHTRNAYPGKMKPGMTFTIEPILTQGEEFIEILEDGWTAVSLDSARSAQFEHTVLITSTGVEVLTEPRSNF